MKRDIKLYGHFIEHFHRQIYGGIYDPKSPFADADGFREDVLEALRRIRIPILRWPGGCFVSAYHWKKAVGPVRVPAFDKAWRVEDPNAFGTDEYVKLCRKLGCEKYICTNAGTGCAEEMSNWLEYCNLEREGEYARLRISNGFAEPHGVKYWSIGNENYGDWEIGAKGAEEWARLVLESAKMMRRVDPSIQLSAAALADVDWNVNLLRSAGRRLDWISIHKYWNLMAEENRFANYHESMAYTADLETDIKRVRGLLMAFGLEKRVKIACDEWNLRGWHHPNIMSVRQGLTPEEYLYPRDLNDRNRDYTMADAVFTACFLNALNRNSDIVGMACFAPAVNTRGCVFTHEKGLVLRSTYHVFDLYVNYLGDEILDGWSEGIPAMEVTGLGGNRERVDALDVLPTRRSEDGMLAVAAVNKRADASVTLRLDPEHWRAGAYRIVTVNGAGTDAYNDVGHTGVRLSEGPWLQAGEGPLEVRLAPHSVNIIQMRQG